MRRVMLLIAAMLAAAWLLLPPQGAETVSLLLLFVGAMLKVWRVGDAWRVEGGNPAGGDSDSEILRETL